MLLLLLQWEPATNFCSVSPVSCRYWSWLQWPCNNHAQVSLWSAVIPMSFGHLSQVLSDTSWSSCGVGIQEWPQMLLGYWSVSSACQSEELANRILKKKIKSNQIYIFLSIKSFGESCVDWLAPQLKKKLRQSEFPKVRFVFHYITHTFWERWLAGSTCQSDEPADWDFLKLNTLNNKKAPFDFWEFWLVVFLIDK